MMLCSKLQQYLQRLNEEEDEEEELDLGASGLGHIPSWDMFTPGSPEEEEADEEVGGGGPGLELAEEGDDDALSGDELSISILE